MYYIDRRWMMVKQMSISETRKKITSLENELSFEDTISVTNHGKEVFALLRWDTYESIAETLEIISDENLMNDLKIGIQQIKNNELIDFDEFSKSINV
jgi:PHD/YefM family antitoxin component YafN of YafNO toxin-antitoxin module